MTREDMILYWREAAEAAEAKIIEQRHEISNLRTLLDGANERARDKHGEILRLKEELNKRGTK